MKQHCSVKAQEAFGHRVSQAIGFDYTAGRLDVTAHPFCCTTGPRDVRLTTRYETHWLPGSLFGTLHEAGHGLYEQGLRSEQFGLPLGKAVSLGIHESQSRMWENMVGRSRAFWEHFYPAAQETFPEAFGEVGLDDFYAAINYVQPSLIRVEADEATYNLHIVIRFELEQAMLCGELAVADLPEAWNQKYEDYLGIRPHSNKDGCMQDVHWAAGLIGYFPTYSLGNLFAGHFFAQAEEELGDLDTMFAAGQFAPLLEWLRTNIHHHGQRYSARELVQRITQENLSHTPLVDYLKDKLCSLYEIM